MYIYKSEINLNKFKRFIQIYLVVFFLLPITYATDSFLKTDKRTDFPGTDIANKVQKEWDKNFLNKIEIVAGESWVYGGWYAGNLSYHLKSRPVWEGIVKREKLDQLKDYMCLDSICVGSR